MSEHTCPMCKRGKLNRSERRGFWEARVLPLFGIFPWRCNLCHSRMNLSDRGVQRYVRSRRKPSSTPQEQNL